MPRLIQRWGLLSVELNIQICELILCYLLHPFQSKNVWIFKFCGLLIWNKDIILDNLCTTSTRTSSWTWLVKYLLHVAEFEVILARWELSIWRFEMIFQLTLVPYLWFYRYEQIIEKTKLVGQWSYTLTNNVAVTTIVVQASTVCWLITIFLCLGWWALKGLNWDSNLQ